MLLISADPFYGLPKKGQYFKVGRASSTPGTTDHADTHFCEVFGIAFLNFTLGPKIKIIGQYFDLMTCRKHKRKTGGKLM